MADEPKRRTPTRKGQPAPAPRRAAATAALTTNLGLTSTQPVVAGGHHNAFEALARSEVAQAFILAVMDRRRVEWLPEARASSETDALFEALRTAATFSTWPIEDEGKVDGHDLGAELEDPQALTDALRKLGADGKLLEYIDSDPAKLVHGMQVYVARAELSRGAEPW